MTRVIINGYKGRMGRTIAELASRIDSVEVVAGVDPQIGGGADATFPVYEEISAVTQPADVVVDFSRPEGMERALEYVVDRGLGAVIATTGFSEKQRTSLETAASRAAILQSANMSLGINILKRLIGDTAMVLGTTFDVEIVERHHRMKRDAPSGTALLLGEAVRATLDVPREFIHGRHGAEHAREASEIGIHAVRGGTIVGEHDVHFIGQDEELILGHKAYSRTLFAGGALKAAEYVAGKSPGLYTMEDLVAESTTVTRIYSNRETLVSFPRISVDPQIAYDLFRRFGEADIRIDMISQTAIDQHYHSLSFSIEDHDKTSAIEILKALQRDRSIDGVMTPNLMKITVEGLGMERLSGVASRIFGILSELEIESQAVTTSETKITCLIDQSATDAVIRRIKEEYRI